MHNENDFYPFVEYENFFEIQYFELIYVSQNDIMKKTKRKIAMPSLDVFARISANMNVFSKKSRLIAAHVMSNPQDVLDLSISDFAAKCKVSDSTVFRFCRELGLHGYPEFRLQIKEALSLSGRALFTEDTKISAEDSLDTVMQKILTVNKSALERVQMNLSAKQIDRAVSLLCKASNVYFFGVGNMLWSAMEAGIRFMQVSDKFHCDIDPQIQVVRAAILSENSVAVFYSYRGATNDLLRIAELAKKRGAKIIVISRFEKSSLADLANVVLLCDVTHDLYQGGLLAFKMGLLHITEILYTEYCRRTPEASVNKKLTSMAVIGRLSQYEPFDDGQL